ncbi:MAG: methionyl-tRNA formyltransferase [Alphaproteobacteria bacterium]
MGGTGRRRVVFMGTPDFAVASLEALHRREDVVCVYSQPPRPAGRGKREQPGPVHRFAEERGLLVRTPPTLKDPEVQRSFQALAADIAVVAAYGLILPTPILSAPRLGCINVHASLLPRWRGAAPIHRAVMAGDPVTGITIMRMEEGLDTGPMLLRREVAITSRTTTGALHDQLARIGAEMVLEAVAGLDSGHLVETPQPEEGVCYAAKLGRDEGRIDWEIPADQVSCRIRGLSPWPGAWFEHADTRVKVLDAEVVAEVSDAGASPGTVLDDSLSVACGTGALRLLAVQRPGREPMPAEAFLRGYSLPPGTRLR